MTPSTRFACALTAAGVTPTYDTCAAYPGGFNYMENANRSGATQTWTLVPYQGLASQISPPSSSGLTPKLTIISPGSGAGLANIAIWFSFSGMINYVITTDLVLAPAPLGEEEDEDEVVSVTQDITAAQRLDAIEGMLSALLFINKKGKERVVDDDEDAPGVHGSPDMHKRASGSALKG